MLTERFKKYLEHQFRMIAPTEEAMEYRQEVLQNLLDRAQEYKIKGMTDENAVYDLCIDSLGDFKATLDDFQNKLSEVKRVAPKVGACVFTGIAIGLFVVIMYLVASFVTKAWAETWLILVGGAFLGVIAAAVFGIVKLSKKKRYLAVRGLAHVILVLLSVFLFLVLQIVAKVNYAWLTFLAMVIALFISDTSMAYAFNSKTKLFDLLGAVEVSAVMVYVMLGVTGAAPWHPFWLIPVLAVVIDLVIIAAYLMIFSKKKKQEAEEKKNALAEKYYTEWKE